MLAAGGGAEADALSFQRLHLGEEPFGNLGAAALQKGAVDVAGDKADVGKLRVHKVPPSNRWDGFCLRAGDTLTAGTSLV